MVYGSTPTWPANTCANDGAARAFDARRRRAAAGCRSPRSPVAATDRSAGRFSGCESVPTSCRADFERQLRVGIEGDDVLIERRTARLSAAGGTIRRVGRAAQQAIQLDQLAALPFPSHPAFSPVFHWRRAVQEIEPIGAVLPIQLLDPAQRRLRAAVRRSGSPAVGRRESR